jgi:polyphosphate kinase
MENFDSENYYINRELSWLAFNGRVLEEAADRSNPLLERLKFLAITSSNLDEFFMVRVAELMDMVKTGVNVPENKAHMTPREQVVAISEQVHKMVDRQYEILNDNLFPELEEHGLSFVRPNALSAEQGRFLRDYYAHYVYPVLTPMGVDASHPFPMLFNKSLNLGVLLHSEDEDDSQLFAVVQVPSVLPRFIPLPTEGEERREYILLEDVIRLNIETLFEGNQVLEVAAFRITRDADIEFDEEGTEDLLQEIERELKYRKMGEAVRLEVSHLMSEVLRETLRRSLELAPEDVLSIYGPIDLTFFMKFVSSLPGYAALRYEELKPLPPQDLIGENSIFDAIAHKDVMVFHPYESFDPVVHFISQAAEDPNVLAIKQTLYRVSGHSPIVAALAKAAENGKQVTVLLEIKARFDEENNIVWAKKLDQAGCHVIYGVVGLKTHSKITLVVRREGNVMRRYVHLGTGNYNDTTARIYTDLGMFTSREDFGIDATTFFNHVTGYSKAPQWKKIVTAPSGMKQRFIELIENEAEKTQQGHPGRIIAKMNAITDKDIIKALYRASIAGVNIELIVRGPCCLRPGISDVSENIRVYSIVGRFLEHSRIFYFHNGGEENVYLASADWMTRNMVARVEILFPVEQENLKARVKGILQAHLSDTAKRRILQPDGVYVHVEPEEGEVPMDSQRFLYEEAQRSVRRKEQSHFEQLKPKTHSH